VVYGPPELASWSVQLFELDTPLDAEYVYVAVPVKLVGELAELRSSVTDDTSVKSQVPAPASLASAFVVTVALSVAVLALKLPVTSFVPSVFSM
jgi:hypothetical protein